MNFQADLEAHRLYERCTGNALFAWVERSFDCLFSENFKGTFFSSDSFWAQRNFKVSELDFNKKCSVSMQTRLSIQKWKDTLHNLLLTQRNRAVVLSPPTAAVCISKCALKPHQHTARRADIQRCLFPREPTERARLGG